MSLGNFQPVWKETEFHQRNAFLMDKESCRTLIDEVLRKKYRLNVEVGFKTPGYKYFKFLNAEEMENLRIHRHLIMNNYGIHPIWCLWLICHQGINFTFYVNLVTDQIIWAKHRFAPELYQDGGTLLEGEMIEDLFLVWDVLVKKGRNLNQDDIRFKQRKEMVRTIIDFQYRPDSNIESCKILVKRMFEYSHLKDNYLSEKEHPSLPPATGLIFIPSFRPMKCISFLYANQYSFLGCGSAKLVDSDLVAPEINELSEGIHPITIKEGVEVHGFFWLGQARQPDNYDQYTILPLEQQLVRVGLVVIPKISESLRIAEIFKEHQDQKSHYGIHPLLKFKCRYLPRFRKWQPIELVA